jgi:hypothetical protein
MMEASSWADDPPVTSEQQNRLMVVDEVSELPGVQALLRDGWQLAPDAPVWAFLPALWPRSHRAWVPNRAILTSMQYSGDNTWTEPLTEEDREEMDNLASDVCRRAGVDGFTPGRIWLLRPFRGKTAADVCGDAILRLERQGAAFHPSPWLTDAVREALAGPVVEVED